MLGYTRKGLRLFVWFWGLNVSWRLKMYYTSDFLLFFLLQQNLERLRVKYKDMNRQGAQEAFDLKQILERLQEEVTNCKEQEIELTEKLRRIEKEIEDHKKVFKFFLFLRRKNF